MRANVVRLLSPQDRAKTVEHFLELSAEDRRLRFGLSLRDDAIREYVSRIDFGKQAVFGVYNENMQLEALAHLAQTDDFAEVGISVLTSARGRGLGSALLACAHMQARSWGLGFLRMQCLTENAPMMHIAVRQGMTIVRHSGEANAFLKLPPADTFSQDAAAFDPFVAEANNPKVRLEQHPRSLHATPR